MSDLRVLRDSLETRQSELKAARELLAIPVDVAQINREVGAKLSVLALERSELTEAIRGIRGLRWDIEETRLWCLAMKGRRSGGELVGALELTTVILLGLGSVWSGVQIGDWLERARVPGSLALGIAAVCCPVLFVSVAGLIRWFRREKWC